MNTENKGKSCVISQERFCNNTESRGNGRAGRYINLPDLQISLDIPMVTMMTVVLVRTMILSESTVTNELEIVLAIWVDEEYE